MTEREVTVPPSVSATIALVAACIVIYAAIFADGMSTPLQIILMLIGVLVAGGALGYTIATLKARR